MRGKARALPWTRWDPHDRGLLPQTPFMGLQRTGPLPGFKGRRPLQVDLFKGRRPLQIDLFKGQRPLLDG